MVKIGFLALLLVGCINAPPFVCTNDAQCNSKPPGVCVLYDNQPGYCAIPAGDCPSRYRYDVSAVPNLARTCAVIPTLTAEVDKTTVAEHDQFTLHLTVRDNEGQKLTTYNGTPKISSTWGDARVFSQSKFVGGEANVTLWLNRETNDADGPATVVFQDGIVHGASPGIKVTLPGWTKGYSSTPIPAGSSLTFEGYFAFVLEPNQTIYHLWYALTDEKKGPQDEIYHATTTDFFKWAASSGPVLSGAQTPWGPKFNLWANAATLLDGTYRLTLSGDEPGIAESNDGINFSFKRSNPLQVEDNSTAGCAKISLPNGLVHEGGTNFRLFYIGPQEPFFCTATSSDGGVHWQNGTGMIWAGNNKLSWLQTVTREGSVYKAWATNDYATSADAIHWVKSPIKADLNLQSLVWNEARLQYVGLERVTTSNGVILQQVMRR